LITGGLPSLGTHAQDPHARNRGQHGHGVALDELGRVAIGLQLWSFGLDVAAGITEFLKAAFSDFYALAKSILDAARLLHPDVESPTSSTTSATCSS
jgi:hypothetical protein